MTEISKAVKSGLSDERIQLMKESLMNDSDVKRESTLQTLMDLSVRDENRQKLCTREAGLVPILCELLHSDVNFSSKKKIITVFAELAAWKENKLVLGAESLGLSALMFTFINNVDVRLLVFIFFLNCALEPVNHEYYLSERLGIATYIRQEMIRSTSFVYPYWFFTNIAATGGEIVISILLKWKIHELFMNCLLFAGADPAQWIDRSQGAAFRSLFSIFYLSVFSDEVRYALLKIPGILEYFTALFQSYERERIPASMILCNLSSVVAPDSARGITSQVQVKSIIDLLVTVFYADVFYETDRLSPYVQKYRRLGYNYGIFKLRSVAASLRQLALQPENRQMMLLHQDLLKLCKTALQSFIEDAPEFHAVGIYYQMIQHGGGGGDDVDTAEFILELLLLLSFDETEVESDSLGDEMVVKTLLWKTIYCDKELQLYELMCNIASIADERGLSVKGIETVKLFLKRLE